jgi:tripartite-type tricarboxylate transporter receptor subunit TctC
MWTDAPSGAALMQRMKMISKTQGRRRRLPAGCRATKWRWAAPLLFGAGLVLANASLSAPATAQDYPNKPITLVVAYPPGGGVDAVTRVVGQKLSEALSTNVIIENRPGFSGNIGAASVARAAPDGYTLLLAPWTTYAINAVLYPGRVGYALDKDFAAITVIGVLPLVLVVNPKLAVNSVDDLVALARRHPDSISFGSTGPGSLEHIAGELLKFQANIKMVHVPYKGNGPAVTDLISGEIQLLFTTAPTWAANAASGRLSALMVTTPTRSESFPDLPTPMESGLPGFEVYSTYGLLAPAGTPTVVVKRLNEEMVHILQAADTRARFKVLGVEPAPSTPEAAAQRVANDLAKWAQIVKSANIKAE